MHRDKFCSLCGQSLPSATTSDLPNSLSAQEEIAFIDEQTRRLEDQILKLQEKKAHLLQRLNSIRPSTTDIPPEILSLIFTYVCAPPIDHQSPDYSHPLIPRGVIENRYPALNLGAVCSLWRRVAWSTPQLWTAFVFDIYLNRTITATMLLQLFFDNAQRLPLSIDLRLIEAPTDGPDTCDAADELLQPILDILSERQNMERIKALRLGGNYVTTWIPLITSGYSQLAALSFDRIESYDPNPIHDIPSLYQFSLYEFLGSGVRFASPENITILNFEQASLQACILVLAQCPNVVECRCFWPNLKSILADESHLQHLVASHMSGITLSRLEIFSWTLCGGQWNTEFLHRLRIPAIHELTLYDCIDANTNPSEAMITNFISRLPPSLVFLELSGGFTDWTQENISRYLHSVNNLHTLSLRSSYSVLRSVFRLLTPQNETALLPDLNTLSLHHFGWDMVDEVEALLSSRKDFLGEGFHLELTNPSEIDWDKDNVERGRERLEAAAKRDGYMIEYTPFNRSFR